MMELSSSRSTLAAHLEIAPPIGSENGSVSVSR